LYDFQSYQNANPTRPLPGDRVNLDLNAVAASIDEIVTFLQNFSRADGRLANGSVGVDQLDASLTVGFSLPTTWETGVDYTTDSTVFHVEAFYLCNEAHTSGASFDATKWDLIADFGAISDEISANAAAAAVSETNAAASASTASTAASTATTAASTASSAATSASASATAASNYASSYAATSTSSLAIATGAKSFTTQSGKLFVAGQFLQIASNANAANYMHGTVTSYSGTSLVMNITDIGGSGTLADWNISVSGSQGPAGTGDFSSNTSSSVDSELVLMSGTGGKTGKRASMTGLVKATSGVASAATAGTDYVKPDTTSAFTAGFTATSFSNGTKSSGTFTPDAVNGNIQHYTNGGAHTLAPPAATCSLILECTNASAGAITTSGFDVVTGDIYSSTGTKKHIFYITRTNTYKHLHVVYVTGT